MCRKQFSPKLLTTHLTEHLDTISDQKSITANSSDIRTEDQFNEESDRYLEPLCSLEVKEEPKTDSEDNYSNFSADFEEIQNDYSDNEEVSEKASKKTTKRKSQSRQNCSSVKTNRKLSQNCGNSIFAEYYSI